jgi:hypothetical protein
VAELALDNDERHAFPSHFDSMSVSQLMWSEPSTNTSSGRRPA